MGKKDNKKFSVKEIFTNRQYRSIAILIFYAILFTVIIIGIRMPGGKVDSNGNHVSNLDGYKLIDNKNFSYKYTVIIDEDIFYYEGKKYDDKELVTVTKNEESKEYYFNKNNIYIKENDNYVLTSTKPYILFDFFDTDILDEIILRSVVLDEVNYKYKVDNQKIYDVLSTNTIQVDSGDNYIYLTYRNDFITGITFDFSNYAKMMRENYNKIIISLDYYDFNLIDDFEIVVWQ